MKITIFGVSGTGKTSASKLLASKLNYEHVSAGKFFRELADEMNMDVNEYDEYCKNNLEEYEKTDKMEKEYGENNDYFVMDGRLAWYFIPDSIKIKLKCDDLERYRRVAQRDNIDFEEAKNRSDHRDNIHLETFGSHYGIEDYRDDKHFDFTVDNTDLNVEKTVEKIMWYLDSLRK